MPDLGLQVERGDGTGGLQATIFADSFPLVWAYNKESETVDLPQGVIRYVDLALVRSDQRGVEPRFRAQTGDIVCPHRYQHLFAENGIWRFTVLASAQDLKPQKIRILVTRTDSWPPHAEVVK
jgi:hypothetical protein